MFSELEDMNLEIQRKQERIDELRSSLTSVSMTLSEKVQSSPTDRMSKIMCEIISLEDELNNMIDVYSNKKRKSVDRILSLKNEDWKDILYMKYIEFMSWNEIARIKHTKVNYVIHKATRAKKFLDNTKKP